MYLQSSKIFLLKLEMNVYHENKYAIKDRNIIYSQPLNSSKRVLYTIFTFRQGIVLTN